MPVLDDCQPTCEGAAWHKGVWKLFTGEEKLPDAPVRPAFLEPTTSTTTKTTGTRSTTAAAAEEDIATTFAIYKYHQEEYRLGEKRAQIALSLLQRTWTQNCYINISTIKMNIDVLRKELLLLQVYYKVQLTVKFERVTCKNPIDHLILN